MPTRKAPLLLFLSTVLSSVTAPALAETEEARNWKAKASLSIIHSQEQSNFNTDNRTKNPPLDSRGKTETDTNILPNASFTYLLDDDQEITVGGAPLEGPIPFGLVVDFKKKLSGRSAVTLSFSPALIDGETFADPFFTEFPRDETDISSQSLALNVENIANTPFSFKALYFEQKIDNEESGSEVSNDATEALDRNGDGYEGTLSTNVPLDDQWFVGLGLTLGSFSADGKAVSYSQKGIEFNLRKIVDRHIISGELGFDVLDYDASNPVFSEVLEQETVTLSSRYVYQQLLDKPNLNAFSILSYTDNKANIDFYNERYTTLVFGVEYNF